MVGVNLTAYTNRNAYIQPVKKNNTPIPREAMDTPVCVWNK